MSATTRCASSRQNSGALSRREQLDRADSTLNKLDEFLTQPIVANIVGQSRTTADFRKFMDEGKVVLVPLGLGRLGEPVVNLLGSLIVLQILNAALSREDLPQQDRRQFNLYADEYQRFATPAFSTLLTEARKYGVATTIAHQIRSQLDVHNREAALNAGNLVIFAVHGEDGEELAKQFDRTPPQPIATGRKPALSVAQNAIEHLLKEGHRDDSVTETSQGFLRPIATGAEELRENDYLIIQRDPVPKLWRWFEDGGVYFCSRDRLRKSLITLNSYLVAMMEGRIRPGSDNHVDSVCDCLSELRAYLGIAPFETCVGAWRPGWRPPTYFPPDIRHEEKFPDESRQALKEIVRAWIDTSNIEAFTRESYFTARAVHWEHSLRTFGFPQPPVGDIPGIAQDRAASEMARGPAPISDLVFLGWSLAQDPILTSSGQWEPDFDRPRPYADVEAELASNLVNQAQFHAHCKITSQGRPRQFLIKTPSWLEVEDEAHKSAGAFLGS